MKNVKKDIVRINTIINKERGIVDNAFISLFSDDLTKLLAEYFELSNHPKIQIKKEGDNLLIDISFFSTLIKSFRSLG